MIHIRWKILVLLFGWSIASVYAEGSKTVNMTLHLVVTQPPPCTVGDTTMALATYDTNDTIFFGPEYFEIPVTCIWDVREAYHTLKLQIQGTTTTINNELVLQTSEPDLGIRLTDGNTGNLLPLSANSWITLSTSDGNGSTYAFKLGAEPVRRVNDEIFAPQLYTASATTILEYE